MKRGVKLGWGQLCCASAALLASAGVSTAPPATAPAARPSQAAPATPTSIAAASSHPDTAVPSKQFLDKYCVTCHNERTKTGGLALDTLDVTEAKTKALKGSLANLGFGKKALVIDGDAINVGFARASSNLREINLLPAIGANVYDILNHETLVLTRAAVEKLEARFNG